MRNDNSAILTVFFFPSKLVRIHLEFSVACSNSITDIVKKDAYILEVVHVLLLCPPIFSKYEALHGGKRLFSTTTFGRTIVAACSHFYWARWTCLQGLLLYVCRHAFCQSSRLKIQEGYSENPRNYTHWNLKAN